MIPLTHIIYTDRLYLRAPSATDIPAIFAATRYPGFNDGMLWEAPATAEELQLPLQQNLQAWQKGQGYAFTLMHRANDCFVGRISIRKTNQTAVWNIGFWTHPAQQGQGYMTEAVAAVLTFGFQHLQAQRIEAQYAIWNQASEKVLYRNHMTFVKYIEQGFQKNGEWVAENMLAIGREQWENGQTEPPSLEASEQLRLRHQRRRPLQWLCFILAFAFLLLAVFDSWWWLALSVLFFACAVYLSIDALTYVEHYKTRLIKEQLREQLGEHIQYHPTGGVAEDLISKSDIFSFAGIERQEREDWLGGIWKNLSFQVSELRMLGRYRMIGRSRKREPYFSGLFLVIQQKTTTEASFYAIPHQHNRYMAHLYRQTQRHKKELHTRWSSHAVFTDREVGVTEAEWDQVVSRLNAVIPHLSKAFITIHPDSIYIAQPLDRPFLEPDLSKSIWDEQALQQLMQEVYHIQLILEELAAI